MLRNSCFTFGMVSSDQMQMFVEEYDYSFLFYYLLLIRYAISLYSIQQKKIFPKVWLLVNFPSLESTKSVFLLASVCASVLDTPCIFSILYDCRESGIFSFSLKTSFFGSRCEEHFKILTVLSVTRFN